MVWAESLGKAYERLSGQHPGGAGWQKALRTWRAVHGEAADIGSAFADRLSKPQKNALRLLLEWWNEETDDTKAVAAIKDAAAAREAGLSDDAGFKSTLRTCSKSHYHRALAELLAAEFLADDPVTNNPAMTVSKRATAGPIAACQRVAYLTSAYFWASSGGSSSTTGSLDPFSNAHTPRATVEACPWIPADKKIGIPYYLWDIEAKKSVEVSSLSACPPYAIISHTWGRWRLPENEPDSTATIPGVPWLVPRNTRFSIEELPDILCHRSANFTSCKFVWFDLFCIPQDGSELARIEISRQAAIFGAAAEPVCWLNSVTDWKGLRGAIHWIALAYLQQASESGEKRPVPAAVETAAASSAQLFDGFIRELPDPNMAVGLEPCGWFTSLWTLQESCLRPDMILVDQSWSKLTLFEEPDAPVISFDTILSVFDEWHKHQNLGENPRAVEELAALTDATCLFDLLQWSPLAILAAGEKRQCTSRRAEAVMSVVGATDWYLKLPTELHEKSLVLGRYPIQFLREVREKQGAAFFASLYGLYCAFWDIFEVEDEDGDGERDEQNEGDEEGEDSESDGTSDDPAEDDEVGGGSGGGSGGGEEDDDDGDWEDIFEFKVKVAGTMLPFDPIHTTSKIIGGGPLWAGFPATETWQLADDAKVTMSRVPILCSTDPSFDDMAHRIVRATILSPKDANPKQMHDLRGANLYRHLQGMFADQPFAGQPRHAIPVLRMDGGWIQGVILMKVFEQEDPAKTFAKIGDFIVEGMTGLSEVREHSVDWEVL